MKAVRIGICLLVAFTALAHGAVEPWSESILEIGAAALFLLWALLVIRGRQLEFRGNWLYPPLAGFVTFALAQRVFGLSLYLYATKVELLHWAAYLLLVFLAVETFRTAEERKGFFWFLAGFGFLVSLFGIIQHLTFNGKLYWLRVLHQGGMPFGPFVNRNHFAGFLELALPPGLAILFHGAVRRDRLPLLGVLTVLPIGAIVLSASRGGILSFLFQLVLLGLLARTHASGRKHLWLATILALAAGLLVTWLGAGEAVRRFEASPEPISSDRRITMLKDTWRIFLDHPVTGAGLGTLETVYPRYESYYDGLIVNHTHNDYAELLSDTGLIGGACGLLFVALLFWRGLSNLGAARSRVNRALYAGSLVACAGLLVHSLVDFNLHIPSNALLFLLLAALAASSVPEQEPGHQPHRDS